MATIGTSGAIIGVTDTIDGIAEIVVIATNAGTRGMSAITAGTGVIVATGETTTLSSVSADQNGI